MIESREENKSTASSLMRNLIWMAWSGTVSTASGFLLWVFYARLRDVDEVGRFAIVMGLYSLFCTVATLGLGAYVTSQVSRRSESSARAFVDEAAGFLLLAGIATAAMMTVAGFVISGSGEIRIATAVLSLAMVPTSLIAAAESVAVAHGKARLIAFSTTIENILRMIVPLALLWFGAGMVVIGLSFVVIRTIALAAYFPEAGRLAVRPSFDRGAMLRLLKVSPTFAVTVMLAGINWQAALIVLGKFAPAAETAKFGVASRFLIPVTILMASYANVIQPAMARLPVSRSGAYISRMAAFPLIAAAIAAALSPLLSAEVLRRLFGAPYADVAPTLDILALSVVPFCVVMVVARGLVAIGAQRIDLYANAVGVAVCFVAGFILVPRLGAKGAAVAQLLSFSSIALVEVVYLSTKLHNLRPLRTACLGVVAVVLLAAAAQIG